MQTWHAISCNLFYLLFFNLYIRLAICFTRKKWRSKVFFFLNLKQLIYIFWNRYVVITSALLLLLVYLYCLNDFTALEIFYLLALKPKGTGRHCNSFKKINFYLSTVIYSRTFQTFFLHVSPYFSGPFLKCPYHCCPNCFAFFSHRCATSPRCIICPLPCVVRFTLKS